MHIRATLTISLWSSPIDPQRKEKKRNYLHGKAPNKQKKNEKYFWVFFLIITTTAEKKTTTNFLVFIKV